MSKWVSRVGLRWYHWGLVLLLTASSFAGPTPPKTIFTAGVDLFFYFFIVWIATLLFRRATALLSNGREKPVQTR